MERTTRPPRPHSKAISLAMGFAVAMVSLSTSGCFWGLPTFGPSLGMLAIPVPVSPYFQKKKEDEFWRKERYDRVPILGPITSGSQPVALDPPSDDEVMVAMEKANPVQGNWPFLYERNRNNVRIVKEKISDYVDGRVCIRSLVPRSSITPITSAPCTTKTCETLDGQSRTVW